MIYNSKIFLGLDLYSTDPAQHLIMAGYDPDDLSAYLPLHDLSVDDLADV